MHESPVADGKEHYGEVTCIAYRIAIASRRDHNADDVKRRRDDPCKR